jgi:hypothetical protein
MMTPRQEGEITVVSCGMLGYGFQEASLERAVGVGLDLIAVDAGSTDPGPYYLGSGKPFCSDAMVRRDLELLLEAQVESGAKLVIGSAGGAGSDAHLAHTLAILRDCVAARGRPRRIAVISSEMRKDELREALRAGKISAFETPHLPTEEDIEAAAHVVAQIGVEPIAAALTAADPDIVIAGRAWDPANIAALPVARGYDRGLSVHAGKILECGALAAEPVGGADLLLGRIRPRDFVVEPCDDTRACTVESVAAHTMYEKTDPVLLPGPGGTTDLRQTRFEALDERRVRVSGTRDLHDPVYRVKLEGARLAGFRNIVIGGIRDPGMIRQIDAIQAGVVDRIAAMLAPRIRPDRWRIRFHRYGIDGVMGRLEPVKATPHEVGLLVDVVGETEAIAAAVAGAARSLLLHWSYPGRVATAGNLALPFSPAEIPAGPVFEFNIYHLMEMPDPVARFAHRLETVA